MAQTQAQLRLPGARGAGMDDGKAGVFFQSIDDFDGFPRGAEHVDAVGVFVLGGDALHELKDLLGRHARHRGERRIDAFHGQAPGIPRR